MCDTKIIYKRAKAQEIDDIQKFVDFWLSGRAKAKGLNGGNDYFVSRGQHKSYLKNCYVLLALKNKQIVGWAVKERTNVLIHLLIAGNCRGQRIGQTMLEMLKPDIIRSKSDQQTGDPFSFYFKNGYKKVIQTKVGKKENIEILSR